MLLALIVIAVPWTLVHFRAEKREQDLRSSTSAYANAVVAFERDHNRPPLLNTRDWPDKLTGPLDDKGTPYLKEIPKYVKDHPFDVIQTRSRSGSFASSESGSIQVTTTSSKYVIQYVPYGRTYSVKASAYVYKGYLLLINVPYEHTETLNEIPHDCEASGDPVRVLCGHELFSR